MGATTTQGVGSGSVEKVFPKIQNNVKNTNLAVNAVGASNIQNSALSKAPLVLNVATITLDNEFANRMLVLDRAAGVTVTLPAASGSGDVYKFVVGTAVSSNNDIVKVANATDVMAGRCYMLQDGGDTLVGFETAGSTDTVTLNGSTTGGQAGDVIELVDIKSGLFLVVCHCTGTGSEATPFSATVS